jgi:hypothetical protein
LVESWNRTAIDTTDPDTNKGNINSPKLSPAAIHQSESSAVNEELIAIGVQMYVHLYNLGFSARTTFKGAKSARWRN